jgi:hypothetical protein
VPTGRLVVLGEPGAGKTMLMIRLVLDLLARRAVGGPVPYLASVASWNPNGQDLRGWLAARLAIDYPALAAAPPVGMTEPTQAAALLASRLILPILDGLDEIPDQVRGPAISRVNDALRPGEPLVVTCRTQQYQDAVRPPGGLEVTLRAAAAVQLRLLDADAVRDYLSDDAAGPAARTRWAPVFTILGTQAPAAQALSTPLMVGLARAIYNPRPGELAGTLRDPAELCNPALPDRKAVEFLLFDAFIPAAYRSPARGRWKAQDAEKWLVFLACHLERRIGNPDLAWWQLRHATARATIRVGIGIVVGVVVGVVGWVLAGVALGPALGVFFGLMAGMGLGTEVQAPARGMRISVVGVVGVVVGVVAVVAVVVGAGFAAVGTAAVTALLAMGGIMFGFEGVPGDAAESTSPQTVLARDRRTALLLMLAAGVVAGVVAGAGFGGVWAVVSAVVGFGVVVGARQAAWPSYLLTVGWLAFRRRLPRSLMGFLADAHQRGVLRQAGAVYQFRHIDLQHRLAAR